MNSLGTELRSSLLLGCVSAEPFVFSIVCIMPRPMRLLERHDGVVNGDGHGAVSVRPLCATIVISLYTLIGHMSYGVGANATHRRSNNLIFSLIKKTGCRYERQLVPVSSRT